DLLYNVNKAARLDIPESTRNGFWARLVNKVLLKLYFVTKKMLNTFLFMQIKVDYALINEISALKREVGLKQISAFPFEKYEAEFMPSKEDMKILSEIAEIYIKESGTIIILGAKNEQLIDLCLSSKAHNIDLVINNDKIKDEHKRVQKLSIIEQEYLAYLNTLDNESVDTFLISNILEYLDVNYLMTILSHVQRVLKPNGVLLIDGYNPLNQDIHDSLIDPRIRQIYHPKFIQLLIKHIGLEVNTVNSQNLNNKIKKYVIVAKNK
ncbi:MAG: methyltransferase domain-containing protein, partial [Ignavibacteriae bacterium]|nr:methyltransferase domain-containing protein [Ignavibacteriota bacterium]